LKRNEIEAQSPDVEFARRNSVRARQLFDQKLVSQSSLDEAMNALDQAINRQAAAQGQLVISRAKVTEATANAEIILEQFPDSLLVPEAAVFYDDRRNASVDRLDPAARTGRKRVPVQVGVGNGTKMQIRALVPAMRAARMDPMEALRYE
jgi:multidrug efflux pump subunit AcrA (membrane-fusion protein)